MILITFLLPLLIGLAICLLLSIRIGYPWILLWMAPGIGIAISSILFFFWSLVFFPGFQPMLYLALEGILLISLVSLLWKQHAFINLQIGPICLRKGEWLVGLALTAVFVFFLYWFMKQTAENPLGSWDAWTIWNSRARYFLFGDHLSWRNVFSVNVNHSDYPYLLTGFIARCWVLIGKDRAIVPVITAGLFTLSTVGLLGAAVAHLRGLGTGLFVSLLLVSLPVFAWTTASEYADLPLAFYFLAALVFLYLYINTHQDPLILLMVGSMAGFALWTKNEGASFVLSVIAVCIGAELFRRARLRESIFRLLVLLVGLLPFLLLYLGFRTWVVPPTDLFENRSISSILQQLTDLERYRIIAEMQWQMVMGWGNWKIPYLPCIVFYALLAGIRPLNKSEKTGILMSALILAVTLLQYFAIYLITPHDLAWHMSTSIGRLYNQLLPGFLLVIFLFTRNAFEPKLEQELPQSLAR